MNMIGNTTLLYLSISLAFIPRILLPGGLRLLTGSRGVPRGKVSTAPPQHVLNLLPDFYEKINILSWLNMSMYNLTYTEYVVEYLMFLGVWGLLLCLLVGSLLTELIFSSGGLSLFLSRSFLLNSTFL